MKKTVFLFLLLSLLCGNVQRALAQVPKEIVYQVMVVDPKTHATLPNQDVKVRIEIRKGSSDGTVVWKKDYDAHTNDAGSCLLTVDVNNDVEWNTDDYYLATIVDGVLSGCTKITSVPYALLSDKAIYSIIAANAYLANKALKTDSAAHAVQADTAKYTIKADSAKYTLNADTALTLSGIMTPEELVGNWIYNDKDNSSYSKQYTFNSDGTGIVTRTDSSNTFNWKLNKAGILYILSHYSDGDYDECYPSLKIGPNDFIFYEFHLTRK